MHVFLEWSKGSNSKIYPYISHHSSVSTPINTHFHYLSTEEDSNWLINMERSAEVFNEVLRHIRLRRTICMGYAWLLKKAVAWGPYWHRFTNFCESCSQSGKECIIAWGYTKWLFGLHMFFPLKRRKYIFKLGFHMP